MKFAACSKEMQIIKRIIYIFCVSVLLNTQYCHGFFQLFFNEIMGITTTPPPIRRKYKIEEDAILTVPKLVSKYGYPIEVHDHIVTEDGYILTMHRIPFGKKPTKTKNRPIVYIQHGIISNSGDTLIAGPENAIAYYFADAGYDVWLGNTRGSRYSTKHMTLSREEQKYWDFSWQDIGYYDLPAMVDHILRSTGQPNLFYIGHSRGTTSFYVMCSERPEYNMKIRAMASFAPVAFMKHTPSPFFHLLANHIDRLKDAARAVNFYKYTTDNIELIGICEAFKKIHIARLDYCTLTIHSLAGFDYDNFNASVLPVFFGHLPDSFALKEVEHFGQIILSDRFHKFDYGEFNNLMLYNSLQPPSFNLSRISAPIALYYSANDLQSSAVDVEKLYNELGNSVEKHLMQEGPGHFSYFNGYNMTTKLYKRVLDLFSKY